MPRKYICHDCQGVFEQPHVSGGLPERCPECKANHRLALSHTYGDQRRRRRNAEKRDSTPRKKGNKAWQNARAQRVRWMKKCGLTWEGMDDE